MPVSYRIDPNAGIVYSDFRGCVTDPEILAHQDRLRDDPCFKPHFRQLADLREVTRADVSTEMIRQLAFRHPFGPDARRAAVASDPLIFGLARMFEMLADRDTDQMRVFTDMDAARKWLELD